LKKERPVEIKVTVVVPIREPFNFDFVYFKHFKPGLSPVITDLISLSEQDFGFKAYQLRNYYCGHRRNRKHRKRWRESFGGRSYPRFRCVELEWSADLTLTKFPETGLRAEKGDLKKRISIATHEASLEFAAMVTALLVASNIAHPGAVFTYETEIWINGQFLMTTGDELRHLIPEVVEFAYRNAWPKLEILSLRDVWLWIGSLQPLSGSVGGSPLSRALNAFTHLLSRRWGKADQLSDLMWAMIGLEAIYGRGTTDLTHQLIEKTGALLGRSSGFEKAVREMYRLRSLFIHGKRSFPGAFFDLPEHPSDKEAFDASMLALAVLLATVQQLAKRKWNHLSFSCVTDDPPRED
jgi:hypothetical protein